MSLCLRLKNTSMTMITKIVHFVKLRLICSKFAITNFNRSINWD